MNRRRFIAGSALASLVLSASWSHAQTPAPYGDDTHAFDGETVRGLARALAEKDFAAADNSLPKPLADISYDDYRAIRFRPDRALWRDAGLPFQVQLFHRGFIFKDRVEIFEVVDGQATRIAYSPDLFDFGKATLPPADAGLGFAGFRFHAPINRPDYFDEVAVFLGASYFRAVGKGQNYGLSAR
ncbi:MAG: glucan biosynthesis protein, partial [Rhizobiales bacterium]|nr:glucan biosynthesis protein [Hyphomicrobiales bacterium]